MCSTPWQAGIQRDEKPVSVQIPRLLGRYCVPALAAYARLEVVRHYGATEVISVEDGGAGDGKVSGLGFEDAAREVSDA